jgi:hypothetical protein
MSLAGAARLWPFEVMAPENSDRALTFLGAGANPIRGEDHYVMILTEPNLERIPKQQLASLVRCSTQASGHSRRCRTRAVFLAS